ncbi:MAG TPA: LysM domain-containing protein, partial [bacterium]|nr:LysM domain-containing protein [bacterium]
MKKVFLLLVAVMLTSLLLGATYTVKAGDTLASIAAANGLTVAQLAQINGIEPPYIVWVGLGLELAGATQQNSVQQTGQNADNNLLLPGGMANQNTTQGTSQSTVNWFHLNKMANVSAGAGWFWNDNGGGEFRYGNFTWRPISCGKMNTGIFAEFGNDFCGYGEFHQSGQTAKIGLAPELCFGGKWFNYWGLKGLYGFNRVEGRSGVNWSKTQENKLWVADLWIDAYNNGARKWLNKTALSATYTGQFKSEAMADNFGVLEEVAPYSPRQTNLYLEQWFYKVVSFGLFARGGYRHIHGEVRGQDRGFEEVGLQFHKLKFLY